MLHVVESPFRCSTYSDTEYDTVNDENGLLFFFFFLTDPEILIYLVPDIPLHI